MKSQHRKLTLEKNILAFNYESGALNTDLSNSTKRFGQKYLWLIVFDETHITKRKNKFGPIFVSLHVKQSSV